VWSPSCLPFSAIKHAIVGVGGGDGFYIVNKKKKKKKKKKRCKGPAGFVF